jgi:hypothetical protein
VPETGCQRRLAQVDFENWSPLVAIDKFDTGKLTLFAVTPIQVGRFHISANFV